MVLKLLWIIRNLSFTLRLATRRWLVTFYLFSFIRKSIQNNLFGFYVTNCKFYTRFGTSRNFQNKGLKCDTFNSKNVVHFQLLHENHHMFYDTHISFTCMAHICIDWLDIKQMSPPQITIHQTRFFLDFCPKGFFKNFLILSHCFLLLLFEWSHRSLEQSGFWWSIMTLDFPNKFRNYFNQLFCAIFSRDFCSQFFFWKPIVSFSIAKFQKKNIILFSKNKLHNSTRSIIFGKFNVRHSRWWLRAFEVS